MANLAPSPAQDEIHDLLVNEVDKRYSSLRPEKVEDDADKETGRYLRPYLFAIAGAATVVFGFMLLQKLVPLQDYPSVTDKEVTITTLSAMAIGLLACGIHYIYSKRINKRMLEAVHNKEYTYSYAPTIGLFIVRFQHRHDLYRCCIQMETPKTAGKENC